MHENLTQSQKNPFIPGVRILHKSDARQVRLNNTGAYHWLYPLSEINDSALFSYIRKEAMSDTERPWTKQIHPNVNLYVYILKGSGQLLLGGAYGYEEETYPFHARDMIVVPRDMPYAITGEWEGFCLHAKMGTFDQPSGPSKFPHPILTVNRPPRPTQQERDAQFEPGSLHYVDPLFTQCLVGTVPYTDGKKLVTPEEQTRANTLFEAVTPKEVQTSDLSNLQMQRKNPPIMGARVIRKADAPDFYNANGAGKQWMYPMGWADDLAVVAGTTHLADSDLERPFDSHAHPDVEECKYIVSGSGWIKFGYADPKFETETYEFQEGDLIVNPRGVPHYEGGSYEALTWHTRTNCFGNIPGYAAYPHVAYVYTKPTRPTAEEEAAINEPGTFIMMDSRETTNIYMPNPILRVEKNPTDMTYLRPDLFADDKEFIE